MRNLILADTQDITRAGIRYLIGSEKKDIVGILNCDNKASLISLLTNNTDALIVLDYTLFDFTSTTELQILYDRYPNTSWMLFSDELSDNFLRFIQTNDLPFSLVLKSDSSHEIVKGLESIFKNKSFYSLRMTNHLKTLNRQQVIGTTEHSLTLTEKEILKEIAFGKTTKEIAADRNLSFHTIITHRKNIFRKLEVNNVHEATKYAMKAGIVDVTEYYI